MGKARIVSGGSNGLYTIEVKYDTTRIDARLADIAATLPIIQAELDALDTQLATARQALTDAVAAMNYQISLINANKPFDGAYIDGLIDAMQGATSAIEDKNIEIDDAYQTLNGYESAIDAATQDETAKRAAYQQAQAALSAYVADTGDTSSGLYLSMVADVENKLAAYQDAQQITVDTKTIFEPQIATQKAEIETLKNQLKALRDDYKGINAEFVAVTQAMEAWSKQDQGAIDAAGKTAIQANAKYVLTRFKRDEKKREVTELTQEQKWLNKAKTQSSETRQAWCADLTTNMAANTEVGTIEIAQEQADIPMLIYPGYTGNTYINSGFTPLPPLGAGFNAPRDGALQKLPNMSPESSWFNTALYPAVAKWKPQYRRGTLTAKSGTTGTVALDATYSSATKTVGGITKIAINQSGTLTNVPFQYMSCNGGAFSVGDRVIVQFVGRDWSQPYIIGFVDNPKPCPTSPPSVVWSSFDVYVVLSKTNPAVVGENFYIIAINTTNYGYTPYTITQTSSGAEYNTFQVGGITFNAVPGDERSVVYWTRLDNFGVTRYCAGYTGTKVKSTALVFDETWSGGGGYSFNKSLFEGSLSVGDLSVGTNGYSPPNTTSLFMTVDRDNGPYLFMTDKVIESGVNSPAPLVSDDMPDIEHLGNPIYYDLPQKTFDFTVTDPGSGQTKTYRATRATTNGANTTCWTRRISDNKYLCRYGCSPIV